MAITINSLTPTNPVATEGSTMTFIVDATDSGGAPLTYQWQYSTNNGVTYTSSGLTNNTDNIFTTSTLSSVESGLYFRVVISNGTDVVNSDEVPSIGNRILIVTSAPIIVVGIDSTLDDYPVTETASVGDTVNFTITASLQNEDVSNSSTVNNISIQWQESIDGGFTWSNITNGGNYSIVQAVTTLAAALPNILYYKYSTLEISSLTFTENLNEYRAVLSYGSASNSPLQYDNIVLYINPQIAIYQHPGEGLTDTQTAQCFKTSIANSGKIDLEIGALSTADTTLFYRWQISVDRGNDWFDMDSNGLELYIYKLKAGTNPSSNILSVERMIYFEYVGFRCVVSGVVGEAPITSNAHYVAMTDIAYEPVLSGDIDIVEDKYGNITSRDLYPDPVSNAFVLGNLNTARNTGLNGDVFIVWQRQDPSTTSWYDVGNTYFNEVETDLFEYTLTPTNAESRYDFSYETPPLRVTTDNGVKYRVKISSDALFSLDAQGDKILTPYYSSDEVQINVYRTIYITNNPTNTSSFVGESVGFAVSVTPSSGSASDITYQWQYSTSISSLSWTNISNGGIYSGATTSILQISSIPSTLTYPYFRCVMNIVGGLSSTTSAVASLTIDQDFFTSISNLNDKYVFQYSDVTFNVTATSLSSRPVTFQWQKSTDYDPDDDTGTWNDIIGQTSPTLLLSGVQDSDTGYYRAKCTTAGGIIGYTNAALVQVSVLTFILTKDIVSSKEFLEGVGGTATFEVDGYSTDGSIVNYQWQLKTSGGSYSVAPAGFNNSVVNTRFYTPAAFDRNDNLSTIRCALTSTTIPTTTYSTECLITVNRRFSYFADAAVKTVVNGSTIVLDLNPTWTGGTPSFQWQDDSSGSFQNIPGATTSELILVGVNNSYNNRRYRCEVTLPDCNQYAYFRSNTTTIKSVNSTDYTEQIQLSVTASVTKPTYYSIQTMKTGAAIGTVICVPKPAGYVNNPSATTDDIQFWKCSRSGTVVPSTVTTSSIRTSSNPNTEIGGNVWASNKPDWANSSYLSPKWLLSEDRFEGYIEMRGQLLRASEFPELARMFGTKYGGTITGTYPKYTTNDVFRMPLTYAKRVMGTGNVNNNSGTISVIPLYDANGLSGGDKNIPGSYGGVYNYTESAQLPPGSPGVSGLPDGTADGTENAETFTIGTYRTSGMEETEAFVQPNFSGTVSYTLPSSADNFTRTPTHSHGAISMGGVDGYRAKKVGCKGNNNYLNNSGDGAFFSIEGASGEILEGPYGVSNPGQVHNHPNTGLTGSWNMVKQGNMIIGDTTIRMSLQSRQLFDESLSFVLKNNEVIPLNTPYFRLKYMIKAY